MDEHCTLQVYLDGHWHDAAAVTLQGDVTRGTATPTWLSYTVDYALAQFGRRDAAALSINHPIGIALIKHDSWPPFLVDLLPQGYGRQELLKQLQRDVHAGPAADWALLGAGAGNPIGNLRIKEAHAWSGEQSASPPRGFTRDEVAQRAGDFNEYLAQHGLFLAGSSGVQGEWPKILLTQARDGLYYLDHTLPDQLAQRHYIVKFGRGSDPALATILRCEAPYMALARQLGLRVHGDLQLHGRSLWIPRFDRQISSEQVLRHAQESLASVCGLHQFGEVPSHNVFLQRLRASVSDCASETVEYLKRDVANIVLGNTDNHARNTAIQRDAQGRVRLTPLFDFAPMFLHPDGIARRMRWAEDDHGAPVWASVIAQAAQASGVDAALLRTALQAMVAPLQTLMAHAHALGIADVLALKGRTIAANLEQLQAL
ncbi:type II toxin-antitoxin system HipA family toxin [Duganella qianjiadongensis]|uniref:Type II toxin-antitoxin system HipA family toxin n=1 Tax=Duganella qianjiadongensis TaxID=2692176 RepID=A0ABW9VSM6_9BURK|nr:HipA domain-containing protein [Duganella qianjiadongensis]MYM42009.1 type II toxin-antitoxin system HipA family toxin [Duganella qianjiadongensis]